MTKKEWDRIREVVRSKPKHGGYGSKPSTGQPVDTHYFDKKGTKPWDVLGIKHRSTSNSHAATHKEMKKAQKLDYLTRGYTGT